MLAVLAESALRSLLLGGGVWIGFGTNLFHAFGKTPPSVATAPIKQFSMNKHRATDQPWLFPDVTLRQL